MALTKLEQMKLDFQLQGTKGIDTAEAALEYAMEAEQMLRLVGPLNSSASYLQRDQLRYEEIALLLEKRDAK